MILIKLKSEKELKKELGRDWRLFAVFVPEMEYLLNGYHIAIEQTGSFSYLVIVNNNLMWGIKKELVAKVKKIDSWREEFDDLN